MVATTVLPDSARTCNFVTTASAMKESSPRPRERHRHNARLVLQEIPRPRRGNHQPGGREGGSGGAAAKLLYLGQIAI